ncbi:hypothetical protein ABEB36_009301 [Hypothenemus hampei]|uniref:Uncharacterized protein n=1 Tax=Hypothenemus hampei TaxID=57062 RepID=A0ABD1EIV1_HYPHA
MVLNEDPNKKFETLLKKGKKLQNLKLSEVPIQHPIKQKKMKSLTNLLIQLATADWRNDEPELAWLTPILPENNENSLQGEDDIGEDGVENRNSESLCECNDDDCDVKI